MANTFETILSEIAQHDYTHEDAAYAIIGHRVTDIHSAQSQKEIADLASLLEQTCREALRNAPPAARETIIRIGQPPAEAAAIQAAYALGQLSMAQQIVSTLAHRTIRDDHLDRARQPDMQSLLQAIGGDNPTEEELAAALPDLEVGKMLDEACIIGVISHARRGRAVVYYLAPVGKQLIEEKGA